MGLLESNSESSVVECSRRALAAKTDKAKVCVCVCVCVCVSTRRCCRECVNRLTRFVPCDFLVSCFFFGSARVYLKSRASAAPARLVGPCVVSAADTIEPLLVVVGGGVVRPSGSGPSNGVGRARGNGRCFVCILRR
jgi:hypothetical protein